MKLYRQLIYLVIPLICLSNIKVTQAQDSFASRCYLNGSLMKASGEGATKYAHIYLGYEICAYYRPYQPIKVKGNDGTSFEVPRHKDIQSCINEMRSTKSKTCT